MNRIDYYRVLEIDPEATPETIAAAYRRLARRYHPDADSSPGATQRMAHINEAYRVLSDPVSRAAYDRRQTAAFPAFSQPPPPVSPSPTTSDEPDDDLPSETRSIRDMILAGLFVLAFIVALVAIGLAMNGM